MGSNNVVIYDDPYELMDDLVSGNVEAAIRGDMSSSHLLPILKEKVGLSELERVAFMEPIGGRMFILAPVGIDEGWSNEQRINLAVKSAVLARRVGMGEKIAIMSGGRCEDVGRCKRVDSSIESAMDIVDILIATDGITGNVMFRTLHFVGGAEALGAPVVNMDKVFVDTSRAKTDYRDSIALAMMLTE